MSNLLYNSEMISNFSPEIMIDNELNKSRRELIYNTEMITYIMYQVMLSLNCLL